uniref:Omega gliadin n=1 Tax=Triticum monococcum TaxID=4568 RepID=A0A097QH88_TRIMO|nr:omega gliadin [Triticum monococcum]
MKTFIIFVLLAMAMSIASATRQLSPRGMELQPPQQQSQEASPYQQYHNNNNNHLGATL